MDFRCVGQFLFVVRQGSFAMDSVLLISSMNTKGVNVDGIHCLSH